MSVGGNSVFWNFGDGGGSGESSPYYTFYTRGTFTVTQTVTGYTYSSATTTSINTDLVAPSGSLSINGGAAYTNQLPVTLNLNATDDSGSVAQMQFSNDNTTWSGWETYSTTKNWTLSAGDGPKTVYARFKDLAGNVSGSASAAIVLDTTAPSPCSLVINAGAQYTNTTAVNLTLSATDANGISQMRLSNDNLSWTDWEAYAASKAWNLPAGEAQKWVYVQFRDVAGNVSATASASIILDTSAPLSCGVTINAGAAYTNNLAAILALSATDVNGALAQMRFSHDNITWTDWENFATSKAWTLQTGDGQKWVYAQYQDAGGNASTIVNDSIILDSMPPSTGTLTSTVGETSISLNWSGFADSGSGIKTYQLYVGTTGFPDRTTGTKIYDGMTTNYTHNGLLPGRTYFYRVYALDQAGNFSNGATAQGTIAGKRRSLSGLLLLLLDN